MNLDNAYPASYKSHGVEAIAETLKLNSVFKGFLAFVSKTELIDEYKAKYYATQSIGQRMYIDPISGTKLINKYLST